MRSILILVIRGYQLLISPLLPRSCKYHPSCSQYGLEAVREFGALRGMVLAGWRLLRCNPFSLGGYDPVHDQKLFAPRPLRGHGPPSGKDGAGHTSVARGGGPDAEEHCAHPPSELCCGETGDLAAADVSAADRTAAA